ncbi:MAG: DoxX family protein [Flavobacteriales bacterium]|nr:DoxX family protein [Flavobacteriales bacterium]
MKHILRIIIALIFIASGFVKAVDAVGFSFKLEEYFSPAVFNMPFFEKQALAIAIIVVVLELVLGFFLLMKMRLKFTLSALIALCVFFGFLTFYSAYFNVVTDCGCFGDALKFTPWQSFVKDIVLLLGLIFLWILYRKHFRKHFNEPEQKSTFKKYASAFAFLTMIFVINWGISHEPLIDFRHYKIGTDLNVEKAKIAKNPSEYKTFYSLKNEKTGEVININQDDYVNKEEYWKEGSPWKIEEGKTTSKIVKQGYESEIAKFKPESSEGMDLTEEILKAPKAVLVFAYNPEKADKNILAKTEAKVNSEKDALVYGVSTNPNTFKTIKNAMMDGTAIKTIARSNPFVLTLQNGKIVDKKSAEDYLKK